MRTSALMTDVAMLGASLRICASSAAAKVQSGGGEMPGMVAPLAVPAATANLIGLVVGGAAKLYAEETGSDTIEGAAKRTVDEISAQLRKAAEERG
jgi:hypothetical protein